jgi:crotonobetainyl-CoA:carnitine CoA-transferase CaiB-like acyl-CoA transferase
MKELFKNLKIIELAGVLAGPSAGLFFSELGAKVIKIENSKTNGDVTRSWKSKTEDPKNAYSAYYWSINAGKESKLLDLTKEKELKILYDLIKDADILITNYKKGDDVKLKVDYERISKIKQDIIYASINGFGSDSNRTAYDLILQAESGFMFMNGEPNSKPTKMPVPLIDLMAGHQLKEAILIALLKKYKTKQGSKITVSLFDSAVASLANQATNWLIANQLPKATGSLHPNIAPYGELFETKDGQLITFAIGSNKEFTKLCEIINYSGLAKEKQFSNNQNRITNRQALYSILYNYIKPFLFKDLYRLCIENSVPIGKVRNLKEVFELEEANRLLTKTLINGQNITSVKSAIFEID